MLLSTHHNHKVRTPPMSPKAPIRQTIGSIPMVPTAGEASPTSVMVDVSVNCSNGVSELKRIKEYSEQLLLPEEMIYGNDLIKVWNIEDDVCRLQEEATYSKASTTPLGSEFESPKEWRRKQAFRMEKKGSSLSPPLMMKREEPPLMEIDNSTKGISPLMEMDDLFLDLPPTSISLPPRTSPPSPLSSSPLTSRASSLNLNNDGSTNTIVLDASSTNLDLPELKPPQRGHRRRGHRRTNSHFDFQFT